MHIIRKCVVITVPCVPHTVLFFVSHIEVYVSVIIIMGWTGSSAEHIAAAAALTPTRTLEHLLLHVMSNHKELLMLQLPLLLLHES